jgi:MFS transporter, ACS family, glucarate transporter
MTNATSQPTRVRYRVLALCCALAMITYLDRVCIGQAGPAIVKDLGLTSIANLKLAFAAFTFAYALFEVPSGWLGDVFGPRSVLIRVALWWSFFTAMIGVVGLRVGAWVLGGVGFLAVVQFLFGMGEAGAFPNITRSLHNWFPYQQRGVAQGTVWMCARLAGGLTPLVYALLIKVIGYLLAGPAEQIVAENPGPAPAPWRVIFWIFGLIGVVWCIVFALWFRNRPEERPEVNAAELALIRTGRAEAAGHAGVPWRRLLSSPDLWLLWISYACLSYGWWFYITYLPNYLEQQYHVRPDDYLGALAKGLPLCMGALGCLTGGFLTDWFIRRTGNRRWGRRLFGVIAHSVAAICFLMCSMATSAVAFSVIIGVAGFFTDLSMAPAWAVCQDIGKRYSAIVAGFMNMIGNLGGTAAMIIFGFVLERALTAHALAQGTATELLSPAEKTIGLGHGYQLNFLIFAGMYVIGALCWLRIDATRPVAE